MSSFIKSKLKNARDAITKKNWATAKDLSTEILSYEQDNYNAAVFLGLASLELGQFEDSENAYRKAIEINPDQILAWQGLAKYYERTNQWDNYADALTSQMNVYEKVNDAVKCAEIWQKLLECRREHGNRLQVVDALYKILPGSNFYPILSELSPPDPTEPTSTTTFEAQCAIHNSLHILEEIIRLIEKQEQETITKEVDRRRMRLGSAGPEQLRKEVGLELWATSKLPELYIEILNHPNTSDDLRRSTESKLLRYKERYQHALPHDIKGTEVKRKVGIEIDDLAKGAVLLNIPDELAWVIVIDAMDSEKISDYDLDILFRYTKVFPNDHLTQLIEGYFNYIGEPLHQYEEDKELSNVDAEKDPFVAVVEAADHLKTSLFAVRILSDVYDREVDYQNTISTAELGLQLLREFERNTGKQLLRTHKAFDIVLAKSLVHLFPPKHHARAAGILDEVLKQDPDNVISLMCQANIYQHAEKWREAKKAWQKVIDLSSNDLDIELEALDERAWCQVKSGSVQDGMTILQDICNKYESMDGYESSKARVWWRLGKCKWDLGAMEESYSYFISSLKRDPLYPPAFTSLGIYYSEFASPSDPKRAAKCFQKAFELDARETEAAQRLADGFAMDREWDLVEVVASRIIEGEGGLEGGLPDIEKSALARVKPKNAWAWRAMGLVELERRNYPAAIQALQISLRTETEDGLAWMFLGEAYVKAGRHAASLKALNKALELRTNDWLCLYRIGEVQREMGLLEEACQTYEKILLDRPEECGVLLNLGQSLLSLGHSERSGGYMSRAETSLASAIKTSLQIVELNSGFRHLAWKTVIDALFELSHFSSFVDEGGLRKLMTGFGPLSSFQNDQRLIGLIDHPIVFDDRYISEQTILKVAMIICSHRVELFTEEDSNISGAWYDLSLALYYYSCGLLGDLQEKAYRAAIQYVKKALEKDPQNSIYWNALGCFNFSRNSKSAQYGFVKALERDPTNSTIWTNLGLFYYENHDTELAMEAVRKALVADPEYTPAWVCEGLVDVSEGRITNARSIFSHAVTLKADIPEADLEYATHTFRHLSVLEHVDENSRDLLISTFFSLQRYCRRRRKDPTGLHLLGLVSERLGQQTLAIEVVSEAITILESAYEETEDPKIERQYAIANTTLGRLLLSSKKYEEAISKFDLAFTFFAEDDTAEDTMTLRASCRLGCGLAYLRLGDMENSMSMFETALEISQSQMVVHDHIAVLLAKAMWSIRTDEYKEAARSRLFDCISQNPENLAAVGALAAIGMLSKDEALVDAALSEILSLPLGERLRRDPECNIENLLVDYYHSQGDDTKALILRQQAVHVRPSELSHRRKLATLLIEQGQAGAAMASLCALLNTNTDIKELSESLRVLALAYSSRGKGVGRADTLRYAQKALKLSPSGSDSRKLLVSMQRD